MTNKWFSNEDAPATYQYRSRPKNPYNFRDHRTRFLPVSKVIFISALRGLVKNVPWPWLNVAWLQKIITYQSYFDFTAVRIHSSSGGWAWRIGGHPQGSQMAASQWGNCNIQNPTYMQKANAISWRQTMYIKGKRCIKRQTKYRKQPLSTPCGSVNTKSQYSGSTNDKVEPGKIWKRLRLEQPNGLI